MSTFSFSFSGDDIEDINTNSDPDSDPSHHDFLPAPNHFAETGTLHRATNSPSAFPISGQALIPPKHHDLESMLSALPSKISYSTLIVKLDGGDEVRIPRRELWDVRVQLMAEEDEEEQLGNLGKDDVRTGIYEGGFKSWESSVDLVRVLEGRRPVSGGFLELGCGTALPSLAVFQWLLQNGMGGLNLGLADYNPTVLQLVTLPNILLSWAQVIFKDRWEFEGELEIEPDLISEFLSTLSSHNIRLSFFSGAWSPEFVDLVKENFYAGHEGGHGPLTIVGAETIYSPIALKAFGETLMSLLEEFERGYKIALIGAKKVYFGVGGSMEDFCEMVGNNGGVVEQIREEADGVRRAVVEVRVGQ